MQIGKAGGWQIAFLIFAVFLLAVPASSHAGRHLGLDKEWTELLGRVGQLALLALVAWMMERIRPGILAGLLTPIPPERRLETAVVVGIRIFYPFAFFGGVVTWLWITGGPLAVQRHFPTDLIHANSEAAFFSPRGMVHTFLAVALAPMVEEVVFRGLLYRAWEKEWGWISAAVASSAVFGFFHLHFMSAFLSGLVFACLYRRTGTLVAPIIAHALGNLQLAYPIMGRFYIPDPSLHAGDLTTWRFHLACMVLMGIALIVYLFMSRHAYSRGRT